MDFERLELTIAFSDDEGETASYSQADAWSSSFVLSSPD